MAATFSAEAAVLRFVDLPVGVSLLALAERPLGHYLGAPGAPSHLDRRPFPTPLASSPDGGAGRCSRPLRLRRYSVPHVRHQNALAARFLRLLLCGSHWFDPWLGRDVQHLPFHACAVCGDG